MCASQMILMVDFQTQHSIGDMSYWLKRPYDLMMKIKQEDLLICFSINIQDEILHQFYTLHKKGF